MLNADVCPEEQIMLHEVAFYAFDGARLSRDLCCFWRVRAR